MKIKIISLFLILVMNCLITFAQESIPDVSIISIDAIFVEKVIETRTGNPKPGDEYITHVETQYDYYVFDFKLSAIIHGKGDPLPFPIHVRLISPDNIRKIYTLEEDASMLETEKIYDYNFGFQAEEPGWFKIEIGFFSPENSPDKEIVFDKTTVFLKKEQSNETDKNYISVSSRSNRFLR